MGIGTRLLPETLRTIDSTTFTGSFQALGTPLEHPSTIIKFVNNSTVLVTISWDGVNEHDVLPSSSFALYDENANAQQKPGLHIGQGTQFYVKGIAGSGSVYLVSFYIKEL